MVPDITQYRQPISEYLQGFLEAQRPELASLAWGEQVLTSLQETVTAGKLLRGSLCLAAYQLCGGKNTALAMPLAAALELMQTALLIHDDIIDNDSMRRGRPSMMAQYQKIALQLEYQEPALTGRNLALCVGDIAFFLGFKAIAQLENNVSTHQMVLTEFAREYAVVGLGEMQDVALSRDSSEVTQAEIIEVYRIKTARYTFSLPLLMAARFCQCDDVLTQQLVQLGEKIGLIFQIKDDELGLFGTEAEIGKPATSDAREGKKTLYYLFTLQASQGAARTRFEQLYGDPQLDPVGLEELRDIVEQSGSKAQVDSVIKRLEKETQTLIADLPPVWQEFATSFLKYNILRKK